MTQGVARSRLAALLPVIAALFVGCGGGDDPFGTAQGEMVICEGPDTLPGIDVSVYQGDIDWPAVKASGKVFAVARVSDGTFKDTKFDQNWPAMKAAGIVRGAYQYFEPGVDPNVQADLMIEKIGVLEPGDLPCTLDVEATGNQSPATITANIHTWIDKIQAATGKKPIIYTGKYFWNDNVQSADFSDHPLWIAAYGPPCPDTPTPWDAWAIWQYSSTGSVPGISGDVDLNKFNGTLADLQALAGGASADYYAAEYVAQSFPLAVEPLVLTVNQRVPASITLKNTGSKPWDESTRLATTEPRDRPSAFVAEDWLSENRLAAAKGMIAPGEQFEFGFTFKAPLVPGTYFEYFGVVQEGVAWFSDQGQGGPPDNQLQAQIQVVEAEYRAEFVEQSFPTLSEDPIDLEIGKTLDGWIDLKNVGTETWKAGVTKLAPTPRDEPSPLESSDWLSATRVSTLKADVPPGKIGRFPLAISAKKSGDFKQTFGLVEEKVTWFADAPKGGGPDDDVLAVHVVVDRAKKKGGDDPADKGCSCGLTPSPGSSAAYLSFAALGLALARRRLNRWRPSTDSA